MQDIDITFTTFVNFVAAEYTTKLSTVRDAKARYGQEYSPATDYWKGAREAIRDAFESGDLSRLDAAANRVDARKADNYRSAMAGCTKWASRQSIAWIGRPVPREWSSGPLTVKVNPEAALIVDGKPHVIKLYLRLDDKLTKRRLQVALHLLDKLYGHDDTKVAVLDVRRAKLIPAPATPVRDIDAFLVGEASMFTTLWAELGGESQAS